MPILLLIAVPAGYAGGTLLALFLDRFYTGAPWRGPLSRCPDGALPALAWTGTIGFLLLRGRCACGTNLPARLCYLPLLGATAGAAIGLRALDLRHAALLSLFTLILLALTGADFERHLLPNRLMYPALALALLLGWAWPGRTWLSSLEGGALDFAIMFGWSFIDRHLGFGDVKLAGLTGLLAGISHAFVALAIGATAGGVAAVILFAAGRAGRKSLIAYGPYLALGAFAGMLLR